MPTGTVFRGFLRISLTDYSTYPKQIGIDPLSMDWGNADPLKRGPVVVSRSQSSIRRRNGRFSSRHQLVCKWANYCACAVAIGGKQWEHGSLADS